MEFAHLKKWALLLVLSLCCTANSKNGRYYITPNQQDSSNCTVNQTTLSPCYTLQQISGNENLHSADSLEMIFLPGTHEIVLFLSFSDFNAVLLHPLNMHQNNAVINCQNAASRLQLHANIYFQRNAWLTINSMRFNHCVLEIAYPALNMFDPDFSASSIIRSDNVSISNSFFENSKRFALSIMKSQFTTIINCTFFSNIGAVYIHQDSYPFQGALIPKSLTMINCIFINNVADENTNDKGVVLLDLSLIHIINCTFEANLVANKNLVYHGAPALNIRKVVIVAKIESSRFINNSGGAILAAKCNQFQLVDSSVVRNIAPNGGGLNLEDTTTALVRNCHFASNAAEGLSIYTDEYGGGALSIHQSSLEVRQSQFYHNNGSQGGAIRALSSSLKLYDSTFFENYASKSGGAMLFQSTTLFGKHCLFTGNSAGEEGGAVTGKCTGSRWYIREDTFNYQYTIMFRDSTFQANSAHRDGGVLHISDVGVQISDSELQNNRATHFGGAIYLQKSELILSDAISIKRVTVRNNSAAMGGAIYASNSKIRIPEFATLSDNIAQDSGGGLFLAQSKVNLDGLADFTISNNVVRSATGKGGAIYILDDNCDHTPPLDCFTDQYSFQATIFNNSATEGSVLYGGLLDRCHAQKGSRNRSGIEFRAQTIVNKNAIMSDPVRVCLCSSYHHVDCATREIDVTKMRGEEINLLATVVDQNERPKESFIRAHYNDTNFQLGSGKTLTLTSGTACSKLTYNIFTNIDSLGTSLILQPEGHCQRSAYSSITVHIKLQQCSVGLELNYDRCECERRLQKFITSCDVSNVTVQVLGSPWIGYDSNYLRVHANCHLDYCTAISGAISLEYPNRQCANHRSGVICGGCERNYSIALGTSNCLQCNSSYAFIWLILVFAVAGLALVALLLVLNMTISHGTLNGIVFYANVVSISGLTNLRYCSVHPILSVFIAWVNLDFGVETCFYEGMDTYQKTWLQFAFPFYICLMVGAIIVACHYSSTAMKVFGTNNVAVLATLFLLSYTKILKTIITALDFTEGLWGRADDVNDPLLRYRVWKFDGNVLYLKGKHVVLFTVALLLLVFLFLPYTLLLTLGQFLRSMPIRIRRVLWIIRSTAFVSIMDAYHAPYNTKHRYWTGLMLLTRCVLFLSFAFSTSDSDFLADMYTVTLLLTAIFVMKMTIAFRVYKNNCMDYLEISFLLNLVILSATLLHLGGSGSPDSKICKSISASISLSLLLFIWVLAYHFYCRINKKKWFVSIKEFVLAKWPIRQHHPPDIAADTNFNLPVANLAPTMPTTTAIDLREPLVSNEKL